MEQRAEAASGMKMVVPLEVKTRDDMVLAWYGRETLETRDTLRGDTQETP